MRLLIFQPDVGYRALGIPAGHFVRMYQGMARKDRSIPHVDNGEPGEESFEDFVDEPEARWGSAVYRVGNGGELLKLKSNFDTSD